MKRPDDGVVSASEIAAWVWCPESWRLDAVGKRPTNQAALAKGEMTHAKTAAIEERTRSAISLGWWLVLAAVALLAVLVLIALRGGGWGSFSGWPCSSSCVGIALGWAAATRRRAQGLGSGETISLDDRPLFSERLRLVGRPDRIERVGEWLIPEEWKPSAKRVDPPHRLQLAVYFLLIEEEYGVRPPYGWVVIRAGERVQVKGKDPRAVDEKLIARYGVAVSKFTRARRKRAGLSNVAYLRLDRMFLLLATRGLQGHLFFSEEEANIRDATRTPIKIGGYAVGFRRGRASVCIERETFGLIKSQFVGSALTRSAEGLEAALLALPFEPYRPVRRQLFEIVRFVNRRRKLAGLPLVADSAVRWHRQIHRPYESASH